MLQKVFICWLSRTSFQTLQSPPEVLADFCGRLRRIHVDFGGLF